MKKITLYFIVSFLIFSCEEVVTVDLPTSEPKLVIDASFSLLIQEPISRFNANVKLTLTNPFFEEEAPVVNNATVFVTNVENETIYTFREINETGIYAPEGNFNTPIVGDMYELTVIYNNETYVSTTTLVPTVPIENIIQGDATLFGGNEDEIIVFFKDKANRDDYYIFNLDFDLFLTTEDRFYQGEVFAFSYFYEDVENGQDATVTINGADQQFYNYMTLLIAQSGQDGGGPFQTTPATLRGNITNITNPDNFPFGYFSISESYSFSFTIN